MQSELECTSLWNVYAFFSAFFVVIRKLCFWILLLQRMFAMFGMWKHQWSACFQQLNCRFTTKLHSFTHSFASETKNRHIIFLESQVWFRFQLKCYISKEVNPFFYRSIHRSSATFAQWSTKRIFCVKNISSQASDIWWQHFRSIDWIRRFVLICTSKDKVRMLQKQVETHEKRSLLIEL